MGRYLRYCISFWARRRDFVIASRDKKSFLFLVVITAKSFVLFVPPPAMLIPDYAGSPYMLCQRVDKTLTNRDEQA